MIALMSRGTLRSDCLERSLGPTRCLAIPSGSVIALRNDTVETRDMTLERRHDLHQPSSPLITVSSQSPASDYGSEGRSEEHTSELQSLMRISYAVFCLNKKKKYNETTTNRHHNINTKIS